MSHKGSHDDKHSEDIHDSCTRLHEKKKKFKKASIQPIGILITHLVKLHQAQ